jgi:hypothetical protein
VCSCARSGGGIGDVLQSVPLFGNATKYYVRFAFDLTFFALVIIVLLNGGMLYCRSTVQFVFACRGCLCLVLAARLVYLSVTKFWTHRTNFYCFCDRSVREKAWRSRKRIAQAT